MSARAPRGPRWSEHEIDQMVGRLLQVGVLIAAFVVVATIPFFLWSYGHGAASFGTFRPEPSRLRNVGEIVAAALSRDTAALVQLGVLLLIATPIARVALTLVAFLLRRDVVFVALSALVLAILMVGLISGRI